MSAVLAIAGADAAERMRRFAFIVVIAAALYAGYLYVPLPNSPYHTVVIDGHTGIFNSAFYGATIAALSAGFLTLFGFFSIRGALERDIECDVDGIVCVSPVRKATFVLGKWLSNAAVLWAVGAVTYLAAMAMEVIRAHAVHVDVLAYTLPYLLITVPSMALVAALAILFDAIPWVRGILGGVLFVMFIWPPLLAVPMVNDATAVNAFDPLGFTVISSNLIAAEQQAFPARHITDMSFGVLFEKHLKSPFPFAGFDWTSKIITQRLGWFAVAIVLVFLASLIFDRFHRENARARGRFFVDVARLIPNLPFLRILRAEFGLIASGANAFWYLGAIGIIVAGALVPLESVTKIVLPLGLIWPLERISALGARERRYGVQEVVSATAGFATKTLAYQWLAGTVLTVLLCSSCVIRLMIAGHPLSAIAAFAVAAAISAVALGLGTTFGASRIFEALFVIVWYVGPVQHLEGVDFASGIALTPIMTTAVCAILAVAGLAATAVRRMTR